MSGLPLTSDDTASDVYTIHSQNTLKPQEPFSISLGVSSVLAPGESLEVPLTLHALDLGQREIHILLLYREACALLPLYS